MSTLIQSLAYTVMTKGLKDRLLQYTCLFIVLISYYSMWQFNIFYSAELLTITFMENKESKRDETTFLTMPKVHFKREG